MLRKTEIAFILNFKSLPKRSQSFHQLLWVHASSVIFKLDIRMLTENGIAIRVLIGTYLLQIYFDIQTLSSKLRVLESKLLPCVILLKLRLINLHLRNIECLYRIINQAPETLYRP